MEWMTDVTPVGVVERDAEERVPPKELRDAESTVVIDPEFEDGLYRIEENDHLVVVFHLHLSEDYTLRGDRLYGTERGVFACRSPNRPGGVGVTTVELIDREGPRLRVRGLDAVDGTPVLDVKPYAPGLDAPSTAPAAVESNPRGSVEAAIRRRDVETLFEGAAALHGAYCPLLAAGVLAATYAARDLGGRTTQDLVAGVAPEGCLVDAVQYLVGATAGNGRLRIRDDATPAVTVAGPDEAIRIELPPEQLRSVLAGGRLDCRESGPDDEPTDASYDLLDRPLSDFATIHSGLDPPAWLPDPG